MRKVKGYALFLFLMAIVVSCVKEPIEMLEKREEIVVYLRTLDRETAATRAVAADAMIDPQQVCIILFAGDAAESVLLDWALAVEKADGSYTASLNKRSEACHAYVIANAATAVKELAKGWGSTTTTTLKQVKESLQTASLPQTGGVITAMPSLHPMCGEYALAGGIADATTIGSTNDPVELTRVTAKVTVAYSGGGDHFVLSGANLASSPLKAFIFPDVVGTNGVETIHTAHYGATGNLSEMMVGINPSIDTETLPLYAYESLKSNETFVIMEGAFNQVKGYYRINMVLPDKKDEILPLLRNYHYRITIKGVRKPGYATVQEAIDHAAENGVEATIAVKDDYSHEIISDGTHFLGVSNSEYWIYDNNVIHEFQSDVTHPEEVYEKGRISVDVDGVTYYPEGNGYLVTTLTYTTQKGWAAGKVTADKGIRFRKSRSVTNNIFPNSFADITNELTLEPAINAPVTKEIIIHIPHDFKEGTVTIQIGTMEKKIKVKRSDVISVKGGVVDLGTGYSLGVIEEEYYVAYDDVSDDKYGLSRYYKGTTYLVKLSTSSTDLASAGRLVNPNIGDHLYLHVPADSQSSIPEGAFQNRPAYLYRFYLTRSQNQGRIKVHLLQAGYTKK